MSAPSHSSGPWGNAAGTAVAPSRLESASRTGASIVGRPRGPAWPQIASLAGDLLLVGLDGAVVLYLRFYSGGHPPSDLPVGHYLGFLVVYAVLIGVFCQNNGLYLATRRSGPLDESFSVLMAVVWATLVLTAFIYLSGDKSISRLVVGFSGALNAVMLPAWRFWKYEIVKRRVTSGVGGQNVLIIGAGEVGHALARHFEENKHLGYVVKGFLDKDGNGNPRVIGGLGELSKLTMAHFVDEVFVTIPSERELVAQVVLEARRQHFDVKVVPEMFDGLGWRAPVQYVGEFPVMELLREPIPAFGLFVKRVVDAMGAAIGLAALAPVLAVLAIAIKLDSPGPAFYCSWRMGKKGRKFRCYKLRTMVANADEIKDDLRERNERKGPFFKITKDPRITRVGRWLRQYSLDELPQLWNVLRGEMSLVGPRPHPLDDYEQYRLEHLRRLDVKPGITGLWQVYGRRDPSFERTMALDLEYIETWSLWLDTKIGLKPFFEVLKGLGT